MATISVIADLCIYILTWNVATDYPEDTSLSDMLSLNGTSKCPDNKLPDIYAIGFQEVNISPRNQIKNLFNDDKWTSKIKEELSDYVMIEAEQMQGLLINIWTKKEHQTHIKNIVTGKTGTGLVDYWGNKGAVSVRMSLYGTGVTFVVAHLAAHDENLDDRVQDYKQIVKNLGYAANGYDSIFDHGVVFWSGDLNFRLNGNDSATSIRDEIKLNNLDRLFALDQLTMVRKAGEAFELLDEQQPSFSPTYKFIEGSYDYDLKRRPAWCDRVLYRVVKDKYPGFELKLQQLSYKSHPRYTLSDHKPVTAEFLYTIKATATQASEGNLYPKISDSQQDEGPIITQFPDMKVIKEKIKSIPRRVHKIINYVI